MEFVVRNPLVEMNARDRGIDNDNVRQSGWTGAHVQFRAAVDKHMRGLSMF